MDASSVILVGPPKADYSPSITITRERLAAPQTAAQYGDSQLAALQQQFADHGYSVKQDGPFKAGSLAGYERIHAFRVSGVNGEIQQWQVYVIAGSDAITITSTDLATTFEASLPLFQEAVRQFKTLKV